MWASRRQRHTLSKKYACYQRLSLSTKSIYACLSCFACLERCPRQVEPVKVIDAIRQVVEGSRGPHHLDPDQVPEFLDENIPQQALVSAFRKYKR